MEQSTPNSTSAETMDGNLTYLYLLYLLTAPPFLLPTKPNLPEFYAVSGQSVTLPCIGMDSKPDDSITLIMWFRGESRTPLYTLDGRKGQLDTAKHFPDPSHASRHYFSTSAPHPGLYIDPVQPNDDGVYKCQVEFKKSSTIHHSCRLYVIVKPKEITITDTNGKRLEGLIGPFDEGSDNTFVCETNGGDPAPAVTWWLGSKLLNANYEKIDEQKTRSKLVLSNLQRKNLLLKYTCLASNTNLSLPLSSSITLDLNLKPLDVRIINFQEPLYAETKTEVNCESYGGRPNTSLSWWMNDQKILTGHKEDVEDNVTRSILIFFPVPEDNGKSLSCRAMNPELPQYTIDHVWKLLVFYMPRVKIRIGEFFRPESIEEGTDVYLECIVDANPPVEEINWLFERKILRADADDGVFESNRSLIIQKITRKWMGRYTCEVSNAVGTRRSQEIMLRVKYIPSCRLTPNPLSVEIGKSVIVSCETDTDASEIFYRWLFLDGKNRTVLSVLSEDNNSRRNISFIPHLKHIDGHMFCWVSNSLGEQNEPCTAKIYQARPPNSLEDCIITNQTETSLHINCIPQDDNGFHQTFHLEVYDSNLKFMIQNISADQPVFHITDTYTSMPYFLVMYVSNVNGRSGTFTLVTNSSESSREMSAFQEFSKDDVNRSDSSPGVLVVSLSVIVPILLLVLIIVFLVMKLRKKERIPDDPVVLVGAEQQGDDATAPNSDSIVCTRPESSPDVLQNLPSDEHSMDVFQIVIRTDPKILEHSEKVELVCRFTKTELHPRDLDS